MSLSVKRPSMKRWAGSIFAAWTCLFSQAAAAQAPAVPAGSPPEAAAGASVETNVAAPNPGGSVAAPEPAAKDKIKVDALAWDPRWGRFSTGEYIATGAFALTALASLAVPPFENTWSGTNGLDTSARNTFRLSQARDREAARDASDLLLTVMLNQLMVDSLVVTWWGHGKGSTAWNMAMIDVQALALTGAINGIANVVAGRERPYVAQCTGPEETQNRDCTGSKRYRSYFSGHTSTSFTIAGLLCQHHTHVPIYGGQGNMEAIFTCTTAFLAASSVGTFRVIADQHFFTDMVSGAAIGTLTGLAVPWVLHYSGGTSPALHPTKHSSVTLVPGPLGGSVVGEF
jgi:membrane-associated phospholipid phosphatase